MAISVTKRDSNPPVISLTRNKILAEFTSDGTVKNKNTLDFMVLGNQSCYSITTPRREIGGTLLLGGRNRCIRDDFRGFRSQNLEQAYTNFFAERIELNSLRNLNEQFEEIVRIFGFSKTDWAKIFSVSRMTVYDWLNKKTTPQGDNATKISNVFKLLETIPGSRERVSQTYLNQNIKKYNRSLKDIFSASQNIEEEYQGIGEIIAFMISQSIKRKERLIKLARTEEFRDDILDYNIRNLDL